MKKLFEKFKKDQSKGAKKAVLQELFNDLNASRGQVYKMNFFRGVFFGVGSVVGGTIVVALTLVILGWLTDIPGGIGDFIQYIVNTVKETQ